VIDDESLVKTRTNICLSYASAIPSYSVLQYRFKNTIFTLKIITISLDFKRNVFIINWEIFCMEVFNII
jgi:hypothetical protein